MIISRFNKYVEKHGKTLYIILGVIICFIFVIFVTPNSSMGGRGVKRLTSVGEMYGRKIKVDDFFAARIKTDLSAVMSMGVSLSQYNEQYLNQQTLNRMIMIHEAKRGGYIKAVTDTQIAEAIRGYAIFQNESKKFDIQRFENFKNGYLKSIGFTAGDFDEMVRENLAIEAMVKAVRAGAVVTEADIDNDLAEYGLSYYRMNFDLDGDSAPSDAEIDGFFKNRKAEIVPEKQRQAIVASFSTADVPANKVVVTADEIKKQYESGKNGLYAGKTLEQVSAEIMADLKDSKARSTAYSQANDLAKKIAALPEQTADASVAAFKRLAIESKAKISQIGNFTVENKLPGLEGEHIMLANALRGISAAGKATPSVVIDDSLGYAVAMVTKVNDGVVPEAINDEYTAKIKAKLIEEQAVRFYNSNIAIYKDAAKASRSAEDLLRPAAEAIYSQKGLSAEQRRAKLMELQDTLTEIISPFYHPEERTFDYVAFPYANYEKSVKVTEEEIKKAFEENKSYFEGQGKKTLEDAREDLTKELTRAATSKLAMEDAKKVANAIELAVSDVSDKAEAFGRAAAEQGVKAESVPMSPQFNYFAAGVASDRALMSAVFAANAEKPLTGAVQGGNAAYVAILKGQAAAFIEEAADRMGELVMVYKRNVSSKKTLERANALVAKLNQGDAEAAKGIEFQTAANKLSKKNISSYQDFYLSDMPSVFTSLGGLKEKQVMAPQKSYSGYLLIRMDSKSVPSGDDAKAAREESRKALLEAKEEEKLNDFFLEATERANMKNIHPSLTGAR